MRVGIVLQLVACGLGTPSIAETLTFYMRSTYPYSVQVEFYSQNRNHEWPGGGNAYQLDDSKSHSYRLSCVRGEKICYGAWIVNDSSNRYWGTGPGNKYGCKGCCRVCGVADNVASFELTGSGGGSVSTGRTFSPTAAAPPPQQAVEQPSYWFPADHSACHIIFHKNGDITYTADFCKDIWSFLTYEDDNNGHYWFYKDYGGRCLANVHYVGSRMLITGVGRESCYDYSLQKGQ